MADTVRNRRPSGPELPEPLERLVERVRSARERLEGIAHRTPVATSRTLDECAGARLFLKCENFQRMGAFKFRGAYNAVSRLSDDERRRGVLTYSSGNHAQAVALASRLLGAPVTIVMPINAPRVKRAATEGYGARVVPYDPDAERRSEVAARLMEAEPGLTLIPPYDHPHVLAGQGTATAELHEDAGDLDQIVVCCGGGGLLSGAPNATPDASPACRVIGVEPEMADDATRSFRTGRLHAVRNPPTLADGTRTPSLGPKWTFPIVFNLVDDMVTVSEEAICEAVRFLFYRMKLVVEPSGALGVAAVLSGAVETRGRVGVLISGGNVDGEVMAEILAGGR
ncbi:MAG: threo-3-hydroxy-L-aspartate ammonia-lyase [Thermoanaerobaculia bacterium]|nr:threo-3-hydroxy-L-aspartate ammonia-lyase [Thermoanaerobaculia bacterium]